MWEHWNSWQLLQSQSQMTMPHDKTQIMRCANYLQNFTFIENVCKSKFMKQLQQFLPFLLLESLDFLMNLRHNMISHWSIIKKQPIFSGNITPKERLQALNWHFSLSFTNRGLQRWTTLECFDFSLNLVSSSNGLLSKDSRMQGAVRERLKIGRSDITRVSIGHKFDLNSTGT